MTGIWAIDWRFAAMRMGIRNALAYRGEFLFELVSSAIVPVGIQLMLWYSIFRTSGQSEFGGMGYSDLLAYTWTSILFTQIRGGNYDFELIEQIRTGTLNNYLLRPVGIVQFTFFQGLGDKLIAATMMLILGLVATIFTDQITSPGLLLGLLLAIMGNIIHYIFSSILACAAFYWENAFAVLMVKNMMVALLCGELIPLSIVPEKYSFVWRSTPFYLYVYGPTQVALGKWSPGEWVHQMGIACLWIAAFAVVFHLIWRVSIKNYQGMGG